MQHDRLKQSWINAVRMAVPELLYSLLWPARVVGQNNDNRELDVLVDHETFRGTGWSGIPLKTGVPGFAAKVSKGARCLVGFEEADPSKPYAMMWEATEADEVTFNGGNKAFSRVGDTVNCGFLLVQTSPSPGTQYFAHDQEALAEAARLAIVSGGGVATVQPMLGVITSGNTRFLG